MAFEAMYDLIGIRIGRRVKAYRHAELFRFAPHRVVVTVMNMTAIGRLRYEAQANSAKLLNRAARLIDSEIDIMQGDQGRWSKPLSIGLARIRHPVIPSAAEVVGILWIKAVVAVQSKRSKRHSHVQGFFVHCSELREGVVVSFERLFKAMGDRVFPRSGLTRDGFGGRG